MTDLNEMHIPDEFMNTSFFSFPKMRQFATIEKDSAGNYHFIKPGTGEKVQIIFRITPAGVLIGNEEDGKYAVSVLGDEKKLIESLLYLEEEPLGVLRREKDKLYVEKMNQNDDLFMKILTPRTECTCNANLLYTNNMSEIISLIFADFFFNKISYCDKLIDFTVWNSSLAGENGLLSSVKTANSDKILFVSLADKKDFANDSLPAIVLKDGNYVLADEQRAWVTSLRDECQFFVGKTSCSMEKLDIHSFDKQLLGIYLPVLDFGNYIEKISLSVLQKTQDLLLKCITVL